VNVFCKILWTAPGEPLRVDVNSHTVTGNMSQDLKILFVGASGVGKTSLIFKLVCGNVPEDWKLVAGFSEIPQYDMTLNSMRYKLRMYDSWGLIERYDRLRALLYADADAFVLCFDVSNRQSFEALSTHFIPEIKTIMPNTPILFVGNKADLRSGSVLLSFYEDEKYTVVELG